MVGGEASWWVVRPHASLLEQTLCAGTSDTLECIRHLKVLHQSIKRRAQIMLTTCNSVAMVLDHLFLSSYLGSCAPRHALL